MIRLKNRALRPLKKNAWPVLESQIVLMQLIQKGFFLYNTTFYFFILKSTFFHFNEIIQMITIEKKTQKIIILCHLSRFFAGFWSGDHNADRFWHLYEKVRGVLLSQSNNLCVFRKKNRTFEKRDTSKEKASKNEKQARKNNENDQKNNEMFTQIM